MAKCYFTVGEANARIPWLRIKLEEIVRLRQQGREIQEGLLDLVRKAQGNGSSNQEEAIVAKRNEVERINGRIEVLGKEVQERDIILRDLDRGLVDFPALRDGGKVYLCWLLGEEHVEFWHDVDSGFASRQPF